MLFKDNVELAMEIDEQVRQFYGICKKKKDGKKSKKDTKDENSL